MIKAIFLDYDGTIYSHTTNSIPSSALNAIKLVQEKGIKVFISSGRAISEIKDLDLKSMGFDGYISSNGQCVLDKDLNIIYENPYKGVLLEKFLKVFEEKKFPVCIVSKEKIYTNYVDDLYVKILTEDYKPVFPAEPYDGKEIIQGVIYEENKEATEFLDSIKDLVDIAYWNKKACDVFSKGGGKAHGIDVILEKYNIDIKNTMGIGDGENDVSMINRCEIGVAMGNATDELKKQADYITDDIDEDGILNCFKYFGLI